MSTVRVGITAVGDSVDVDVSIASAEMLEFLYHNEASIPDIKPVSVQPVSHCVHIQYTRICSACMQLQLFNGYVCTCILHDCTCIIYIFFVNVNHIHCQLPPPSKLSPTSTN